MQIIQVTTITLEDGEINALAILKQAYNDCVIRDCYECDQCPLYLENHCLGVYASMVLKRQKERGEKI